jgi:hypothetical protein
MARYKVVDRSPKFLPVVLDAQIQPGSFEYALDYLIDHEIDLSRSMSATLMMRRVRRHTIRR